MQTIITFGRSEKTIERVCLFNFLNSHAILKMHIMF